MRVLIVGAGPAGLTFGYHVKKALPASDVTLLEKRTQDESSGWGITLPRGIMAALDEHGARPHVDIKPMIVKSEGRVLRVLDGFSIHGIARQTLRDILLRRCVDAGVHVEFGVDGSTEVGSTRYDLVVGCDGAASQVRALRADGFGERMRHGRNRFVWLAADRALPGLGISLRRAQSELLCAWYYPYASDMSTVIVECSDAAWKRLSFDTMSMDECVASLSSIFGEDLNGARLMHGDRASWRLFPCVSNDRWAAGNVTLLGDALHTTHFSVGAGTMLALQDARVLAHSIAQCDGDVALGLRLFEFRHRPHIDLMQASASGSMRWFEMLHDPENADAMDVALKHYRPAYSAPFSRSRAYQMMSERIFDAARVAVFAYMAVSSKGRDTMANLAVRAMHRKRVGPPRDA